MKNWYVSAGCQLGFSFNSVGNPLQETTCIEELAEGLQEKSPYSLKESSRILNETVQTLKRKAWVLLMEALMVYASATMKNG